MHRCKIIISGFVQGVSFRSFIKKHAISLNIKGYAKNTPDGNIEVICEGEKAKIQMLIERCKRGPQLARVTKIEIEAEDFKNQFENFSI